MQARSCTSRRFPSCRRSFFGLLFLPDHPPLLFSSCPFSVCTLSSFQRANLQSQVVFACAQLVLKASRLLLDRPFRLFALVAVSRLRTRPGRTQLRSERTCASSACGVNARASRLSGICGLLGDPSRFRDALAVGLCAAVQWTSSPLDPTACTELGSCCRVGEAKNPDSRHRVGMRSGDLESRPLQSGTSLSLTSALPRSLLSCVGSPLLLCRSIPSPSS